MSTTTVCLAYAAQMPNAPAWDWRTTYSTDLDAELTTDHSRASYGQPVLLYQGQAFGPADIKLDDDGYHFGAFHGSDPDLIQMAEAAGWKVKPHTPAHEQRDTR